MTNSVVQAKTSSADSQNEIDLQTLIRLANKFQWATDDTRRRLEEAGVNLARSDFYSESPTLREIDSSFEYRDSNGVADTPAIFDDANVFNMAEIEQYTSLLVSHTAELIAPVEPTPNQFYWSNNQFSWSDAAALYAIIRKEKPKTVIEIGSGFSTFMTWKAISDNGRGRLICIDPAPRADITSLPDIQFLSKPLQETDLGFFLEKLEPGDFVFYDGSHTIKTGSDAVYFYLKILPYLPSEIFVHAHDVRLPYPPNIRALKISKIYWGEPYLLMAHLHNRSRYKVLFGSNLLDRKRPDLLKQLMRSVPNRWGKCLV